MSLESFVKKVDLAEKEVEDLFHQLDSIEKAAKVKGQPKQQQQQQEIPEELKKLRLENAKLNYRLNILKKATEKASSSSSTG